MDFADSKRLTAAGARKMMATAIARAQEAGIAVTVAIADAGGHLLLLERMEGGRFHTVHSATRSEEHTSELQSQSNLVCRLLLEKKKKKQRIRIVRTQ